MELVERRRPDRIHALADAIATETTQTWTLMEVCGGQTNSIVRYGLDQLLPPEIELVHGPGCPVCVTPIDTLDAAIGIAALPSATLCSFGDMLRVPGSKGDLLGARAKGADVRVVYTPLDAVELARSCPDREVVFFAVGFETTAPAVAMAAHVALLEDIPNFSLLVAHVTVPPAIEAILSAPENRVQGFLAAGHVCAVMGWEAYVSLAERYRVPIVVTGFEPQDLLEGVLSCVRQLERGTTRVENQYVRAVRREGNRKAQELMARVFQTTDVPWRGLGVLPDSGLELRAPYSALDARLRFDIWMEHDPTTDDENECQSGLVLQGRLRPPDCPAFGRGCTPETPLGAPMVSAEGACAAYHRHGRPGTAQTARNEGR